MAKNQNFNYATGRKERATYFLFYLGQNILWGYAGYVETFLTDIGIAAGTAAMVLLFPKLWDAINDVLFGYIVDRHTFKNGQKFLPWVKIGSAAVGITTVVLFAIPASLPQAVKVVWFLVAYILFDISYTIQDAPAFALSTVMTSNVDERSAIIAGGKLWAMVGGVIATLLVPLLRPVLGWFAACIIFVAVSLVLMIPMVLNVKERQTAVTSSQQNPTFREMLVYLKANRPVPTADAQKPCLCVYALCGAHPARGDAPDRRCGPKNETPLLRYAATHAGRGRPFLESQLFL